MKIDRNSNQFKMALNDKFEKDLMPEIKKIVNENSDLINDKQVDDFSILTDLGHYRIKVIIRYINVNIDSDTEPKYRVVDYVILASKKE